MVQLDAPKHPFPFNASTLRSSFFYLGDEYLPLSKFIDKTNIHVCTNERHFVNVPFAIYEDECCREYLDKKYLLFADDNVYIKGTFADMLISKAAQISVENYANERYRNGVELDHRTPRNI